MAETLAVLRVYTREEEQWQGKSLSASLIAEAQARDLAGATVLRGSEGFGADHRLHRAGLVDFSPDLPLIVELVDSEATLRAFAAACAAMLAGRLATLHTVERLG